MAEKSGLEMLEEILFRLTELDKRIDLLDKNIKILTNGVRSATIPAKPKVTQASPPGPTSTPGPDPKGFKNFSFKPESAPVVTNSTILVKGKLKLSGVGAAPLANVSVTIFDTADQIVKKTKTNKSGQWMSQLAPGKYVALFEGEVDGKKLAPVNKNFEVPKTLPPGQTEFEIV